jgi:diadenosine tetraphosphate (Ap4A) HIT family hydrolase
MKNCCFCERGAADEFWNKPVFETSKFVVLPSLGSLVEGWLLLIPRKHAICLGALDRKLVPEMTI